MNAPDYYTMSSPLLDLDVDLIQLNPKQPRKYFDEAKLDELSESIIRNGVLEPVIVRPLGKDSFELVAGERRFRATVQAGLTSIPAVVKHLDDRQTLEIGLIENIQREDISPLECAEAYRRLIDDYGMTQERVAEGVGKSRSSVANTLRLLNLPQEILASLGHNEISEGHARALLSLPNNSAQVSLWRKIIREGLSVRAAERLSRQATASSATESKHVSRATSTRRLDPNIENVEDTLRRFLGTKVTITQSADKGRIEIEFYDDDDLMRIIDLMSGI